ncbi:MAG: hypothetical protein JJT89_16675 [Nitriliruptoraceae bacterium]|nr:hypothetical protein [Nitriliruptoraceae bacterium]
MSSSPRIWDDTVVQRRLLELIDGVASGDTLLVVAVVVAAGIGALHALAPGHGKVLVGAWLLSGEGRGRDAVGLGVLVGLMHTASVLALGLLVLGLGRAPGGTRWPDVVTALIGLVIVGLGARLLRRVRRPVPVTAGPHDGHDGHEHGPPAQGVRPLSRRGLVALAASGGLLPSPGALALLATALAVGRPLVGLLLVAVFGLGLGASLTAIGLAVLGGRRALSQRTSDGRWPRVRAALPAISAVAVVVAGGVLTVGAVTRLVA